MKSRGGGGGQTAPHSKHLKKTLKIENYRMVIMSRMGSCHFVCTFFLFVSNIIVELSYYAIESSESTANQTRVVVVVDWLTVLLVSVCIKFKTLC